jgi:hypothetical protein
MFEDNQSVVTNSMMPHSSLNKRYSALAYHHVREMIASHFLGNIGLMGNIIQQMLSVNIGAINRYGGFSNHYYSILATQGNFWNLMEVIETTSHRDILDDL